MGAAMANLEKILCVVPVGFGTRRPRRSPMPACSAHLIMAVTGQTLAMVERYTKHADQKRNAKAAMAMLERTRTERETAKPQK
jgi:hypothetical protein